MALTVCKKCCLEWQAASGSEGCPRCALVTETKRREEAEAANARLREALEFYADEQNWRGPQCYPPCPMTDNDKGAIARTALAPKGNGGAS